MLVISKEKLKRINELAAKARDGELSYDEKEERQALREEYLKAFRSNFDQHLKTIKVVDNKGNDITPQKLKDAQKKEKKN
jgi:uncharacterized protein YnzC (UPF0291/DUF896 family)